MKREREEWEVVHAYSRRQAIEDGVLIEVPARTLRRFGIRYPVAITRSLWARCIGRIGDDGCALCGDDPAEAEKAVDRLLFMLEALRNAARSPRGQSDLMTLCLPDLDERPTEVWAHCGPGDTPEPVITLMLPEDY